MSDNFTFDPNGPAGENSGIFGLPYTKEQAQMVLYPVTWDVSVSYAAGTSDGPEAILEASKQVDLFLRDVPQAWNNRIYMEPVNENLYQKSKTARVKAEEYIDMVMNDPQFEENEDAMTMQKELNAACQEMVDEVYANTSALLNEGKMVGLIGGDHSTPYGYLKALAEKHQFSILQFDAHCDLRHAYEGFTYSHASIMYNAMQMENIQKLVQVGIRDWCQEEQDEIDQSNGRIVAYFDECLKNDLYSGKSWDSICDEIIAHLTDKVYISFDIDALDPKLCPNTGTPVPGGLEFYQALSLIKKLVKSGKQIVGFDVVEVAPGEDEWDANVGARLIYQIANQIFINSKK